MPKSLIEIAYEFVAKSETQVPFVKIWEYVKKEAELSEEVAAKKVGQFFTNMMLDGRFVTLGENEWDLRSRHTFDKVHIDMRDVYNEDDIPSDDLEEEAERRIEEAEFEDEEENSESNEENNESSSEGEDYE